MDFELNEKQRGIRSVIRDFIRRECPDRLVREMDKRHEVPSELFKKLADTGVCGLMIPEQYGGAGVDLLGALVVYEELARQWPALSWIYCGAVFYGGAHIAELGDDSQKRNLLPQLARGEILFSYALTEPGGGSDLGACQTMATARGQDFAINGQKTYISAADIADYWLTLVRTSKELPRRQAFTMFIVNSRAPGTQVRPIEKLGFWGCNACEVFFDNTPVSKESILGGPSGLGKGWEQLLKTLVVERLEVAACAIGIAQGALDKALAYARDREQYGQPIIGFQGVSHRLAEMATEVQAARLLVYYAAYLDEQGRSCYTEASMAKLFASDVAKRNAQQAVLIAGGHGYMMESEMQRYYRDSLGVVIGGGTPEIEKESISKGLQMQG